MIGFVDGASKILKAKLRKTNINQTFRSKYRIYLKAYGFKN